MTFKMQTLYTSPIARLFARFAKNCTVILVTGKKLKFKKFSHFCISSYEGSLSKQEEEEWIHALRFMGH